MLPSFRRFFKFLLNHPRNLDGGKNQQGTPGKGESPAVAGNIPVIEQEKCRHTEKYRAPRLDTEQADARLCKG